MPLFSENKMLDMGTQAIAVRVGSEPNHTDFTIHETLIRKSSPFFELSLSKKWRESEERMVRLPACEAAPFQLYAQWLYTGRLHVSLPSSIASESEGTKLLRGYTLGEYLQDITFQDDVIDAMLEWITTKTEDWTKFVSASVKAVYEELKEGSPFRKLLVDLTIWRTTQNWWQKTAGEYPIEFVRDVSIGLFTCFRNSEARTPFGQVGNKCAYHSHKDKSCHKAEVKSVTSGAVRPTLTPKKPTASKCQGRPKTHGDTYYDSLDDLTSDD